MSTITAISTALGGGIGIVRISGTDSFKIVDKIFKAKNFNINNIKETTIKYGNIVYNEKLIDEVIVSFFKAPHSYTCEDVVEINCHGGAIVVKKILDVVLENGATLAEPGEFTKRAFLNGRIDLSQAEAVSQMITAKTENERKTAVLQLEGKLSIKIGEIRDILINSAADIQAYVDYPEYDVPELERKELRERIEKCLDKLTRLEKTFFEGNLIRDGVNIAIIGKPNVGKSSLLNALIQKDRAIITNIPGTTRDIIEEYIQIGGIPVKIVDTAGLRETTDIIENIGIDRTRKEIEEADYVLLVIDGSRKLEDEDKEILESIKNKNSLIVINKSDLKQEVNVDELKKYNENIVIVSAEKESGISKIEENIKEYFELNSTRNEAETIVTNVRQQEIIKQTKKELEDILTSLEIGTELDIISISISNAIDSLGKITGETASDDIINNIFSKFCLGK